MASKNTPLSPAAFGCWSVVMGCGAFLLWRHLTGSAGKNQSSVVSGKPKKSRLHVGRKDGDLCGDGFVEDFNSPGRAFLISQF